MGFALLYAAAVLPLSFMLVYVSQMLWIWHFDPVQLQSSTTVPFGGSRL
jgi:hypothetical protein